MYKGFTDTEDPIEILRFEFDQPQLSLFFVWSERVIWRLVHEQAESYADGRGDETSSHSFWWNNWLSSPISHHLCMHESWIAITCDFVAMSTEGFDFFLWGL